jgi:putative transposase
LFTKITVETLLNAERFEQLGHKKNTLKSGSNTHNAYSSKTLQCGDGEIEMNRPCDRENNLRASAD